MNRDDFVLITIDPFSRILLLAVLLSGLPAVTLSSPLFESGETLDVIIEAPLGDLSKQRSKDPAYAGTFHYTDASGTDYSLPVTVSTRGRSRLDVCDYPPLRLTFDPTQTEGTLFEAQHELKLVRQCMRGAAGRDWVQLELGAYHAYNAITDYSFRTRPLNAVFLDTESRFQRDQRQPAFLLEEDDQMAQRLNRRRIRPPQIEPEQMAIGETTRYMLFQYLIGNTDFSVKRGPKGEACCHNGRVLTEPGRRQDWIIVPYDFDYAGIINTEYAAPHESLPIKRVTTRLYRGFCWHNAELADAIELFNRKRGDIEAALLSPELSRSRARRVGNYVERFYEIINDPQERKEHLLDKCRGPESLPIYERTVSPRFVKTP